mgnify:FL=1
MKACLGESKQEELNDGYNKNFQEHQIPDAVLQPLSIFVWVLFISDRDFVIDHKSVYRWILLLLLILFHF